MNNNNEVDVDIIKVNHLYRKEIKVNIFDKSKPPVNQDYKSSKLHLNVATTPFKNFEGSDATHSSDVRFNAMSHSIENVDSESFWKKSRSVMNHTSSVVIRNHEAEQRECNGIAYVSSLRELNEPLKYHSVRSSSPDVKKYGYGLNMIVTCPLEKIELKKAIFE